MPVGTSSGRRGGYAARAQLVQRRLDHADRAVDDLGPRGDDRRGLLALEHGLGDLGGVGEMTDPYLDDLDPGDLDARLKWPDYTEAYEAALEQCNTPLAPWHVIPADRKWYRNWAVAELLRETLAGLAIDWPKADFDVEAEKKRLASA